MGSCRQAGAWAKRQGRLGANGSGVFLALLVQLGEIDALLQTVHLVSGGFEFVDPGAHPSGVSEHPDHRAHEDDRQYRVKDIDRFHTAGLDGGNRVFGDLRASFLFRLLFCASLRSAQNKFRGCCNVRAKARTYLKGKYNGKANTEILASPE